MILCISRNIASTLLVVFTLPTILLSQEYYLPFPVGESRTCTQGNNSGFEGSHNTDNSRYAYDFFGVKDVDLVCASRGGLVTHIEMDYPNDNCPFISGEKVPACVNNVNRIIIKHDDGSRMSYLHLAPDSNPYVEDGQRVEAGQVIGRVGNSGYSSGAHLHVQLMIEGEDYQFSQKTIPFSFADFPLNSGVPKTGDLCTSNSIIQDGFTVHIGNGSITQPQQLSFYIRKPNSSINQNTRVASATLNGVKISPSQFYLSDESDRVWLKATINDLSTYNISEGTQNYDLRVKLDTDGNISSTEDQRLFFGKVKFQDPNNLSVVQSGSWVGYYTSLGVRNGVFSGRSRTDFGEEETLLREEAAYLLAQIGLKFNLLNYDLSGLQFPDDLINHKSYFYNSLLILKNNHIISDEINPDLLSAAGKPLANFGVGQQIDYGEFSTLIVKMLDKSGVLSNLILFNNTDLLVGEFEYAKNDSNYSPETIGAFINNANTLRRIVAEVSKHIEPIFNFAPTPGQSGINADLSIDVKRGNMAKIMSLLHHLLKGQKPPYDGYSKEESYSKQTVKINGYQTIGTKYESTITAYGSIPPDFSRTRNLELNSGVSQRIGFQYSDGSEVSDPDFGFYWSVDGGDISSIKTNHSQLQFTAPVVSTPTDIHLYGYVIHANGKYGEVFYTITVLPTEETIPILAPSETARNLDMVSVTDTEASFTWERGNGDQLVGFITQSEDILFTPIDGHSYQAGQEYYGENGAAGVCFYNGTGNSASVSGLLPGTGYFAHIYEYNGTGTDTKYNRDGDKDYFVTRNADYYKEIDLFISDADFTPKTNIFPGTRFEITATVTNRGDKGTIGESHIGVYLSKDKSFTPVDDIELDDPKVGLLNPGESATINISVATYKGEVPGNYYILFVADSRDDESESDESNNILAYPFTLHKVGGDNLQLSNIIRVARTYVTNETSNRFYTTLQNFNTGHWKGSLRFRIVTSDGTTVKEFIYSDQEVSGENTRFAFSASIDHISIPVGEYTLVLEYNDDGMNWHKVSEGAYENPIKITVVDPSEGLGLRLKREIIITNLPNFPGDSSNFSVSIENLDSIMWTGEMRFEILNEKDQIIDTLATSSHSIGPTGDASLYKILHPLAYPAGWYKVRVTYRSVYNDQWLPVNGGDFSNPRYFEIQEHPKNLLLTIDSLSNGNIQLNQHSYAYKHGTHYLVWSQGYSGLVNQDQHDGYIKLSTSTDGTNWSTEDIAYYPLGTASHKIWIDDSGFVHILFDQGKDPRADGMGLAHWKVVYLSNSSGSWQSTDIADYGGYHKGGHANQHYTAAYIIKDSDGDIHAMYNNGGEVPWAGYLLERVFDGQAWTKDSTVVSNLHLGDKSSLDANNQIIDLTINNSGFINALIYPDRDIKVKNDPSDDVYHDTVYQVIESENGYESFVYDSSARWIVIRDNKELKIKKNGETVFLNQKVIESFVRGISARDAYFDTDAEAVMFSTSNELFEQKRIHLYVLNRSEKYFTDEAKSAAIGNGLLFYTQNHSDNTSTLKVLPYESALSLDTFSVEVITDSLTGSVSGAGNYLEGETIELIAIPNLGFTFAYWELDSSIISYDSIYQTVATADVSYFAHFTELPPAEPIAFTIQLQTDTIQGAVTGAGQYQSGDTATIVAYAHEGYEFVYWMSDSQKVSYDSTFSFIVATDTSFSAHFSEVVPDSISIIVQADSIKGETIGSGRYAVGDSVTISAVSYEGYEFSHWLQDTDTLSTDSSYQFIASGDAIYTAIFDSVPPAVPDSVTISIATDSTRGVVQGGGLYQMGDTATLIAIANEGYAFSAWELDSQMVSQDSLYQVIATVSETYTAIFDELPPEEPDSVQLTLIADNSQGSVVGAGTYRIGDTVLIEAHPIGNYLFDRWEFDNTLYSRESSTSVIMEADMELAAYFIQDTEITVTIVAIPEKGGNVWGAGSYHKGDTVLAFGNPKDGYLFSHWEVGGVRLSSEQELTIQPETDMHLEAHFEEEVVLAIDDPVDGKAKVQIYPNPAKTLIALRSEGIDGTFQLFDADGKELRSGSIIHDETIHIDVSTLPSGVYSVVIQSNNERTSQNVIIRR